ncbi:MAG: MBL fold metallo-hydrolase [Firmicutes bacterium]|nr:MBL fold metallo-hydrolase [Bacillota bacterium]
MKIQTAEVGLFQTNCYILTAEDGACLVIDPGDANGAVLRYLQQNRIRPDWIVVTHGHQDHYGDAAVLAKTLDVPILYPEGDVDYVLSRTARSGVNTADSGEAFIQALREHGHLVRDGERLEWGGVCFRLLTLAGHTDAGLCLYDPDGARLWAGDNLFYGSIGRTDLYRGDPGDLVRSITQKLLVLPDQTTVYSGHGRSTTIGFERAHNPYLQEGGAEPWRW